MITSRAIGEAHDKDPEISVHCYYPIAQLEMCLPKVHTYEERAPRMVTVSQPPWLSRSTGCVRGFLNACHAMHAYGAVDQGSHGLFVSKTEKEQTKTTRFSQAKQTNLSLI